MLRENVSIGLWQSEDEKRLPHLTSCFLGAGDSSFIVAIIDSFVIQLYHKISQCKFSPLFIGGLKGHVTVGPKESVA